MISPQDRRVLDIFAQRVRAVYPNARIWAFGSRARGNAAPESDLDICVVLDSLTPREKSRVRDLSWEVAFENERVFNTVLFSADEFENGPASQSTLKENILREGVAA